jgi:chromosome segregation ATPase
MRASLTGDVDMAIVLPLDVVANKLKRLEEELRQLNRKALTFEQERESGDLKDLIEPRLERIRETIRSIRSSLLDLSADIEPQRDDISGTPPDQPHAIARTFTEEDTETRFELENSTSPRKPQPDRED